jgi:hypothetical protein
MMSINTGDKEIGKLVENKIKMLLQQSSAILLQKWWRRRTNTKELRIIHNYLSNSLSKEDLQDLSNKCHSITKHCKGDGAGLSGGTLIDMLLCKLFETKLPLYSDYHDGESDMKICGVPLSQKKINGKSSIALDWSKNETKTTREHFSSNILIINLKTGVWWVKNLVKPKSNIKITYNDVIPSGIYLIDKQFCKYFIELSCNNKTNTLIDHQFVYIMLKRSISQKLCIDLPTPNKDLKFNILNAFS